MTKKGPKRRLNYGITFSTMLCILQVGLCLNMGDAIYTAHLELFLDRETRMAKDR